MYWIKQKLHLLFQLLFKLDIMNLFNGKTLENFNRKYPDFLEKSICNALDKHVENCNSEDMEDLKQEVLLKILEINQDKEVTQETLLADIRQFAREVVYDYLRGKSEFKTFLNEQHVA